MAGAYYKPCKEFDICNELIEKYRNQDGSRNEFVYKLVMAYVEWKGYEMNQKSVVAA